ncbi:MAG: hypothetical protein NWS75_02975 [Solirubrobacteraceae bacterium]|nr:hypothetical protein [Solirubrobacteraceae bacterium]
MSPSEPQHPTSEKDVLTNLPRSRRQRPSVRREAARMSQASADVRSQVEAASVETEASLVPEVEPVVPPTAAKQKRTSSVPRAGYATPDQGKNFGNADPAGLLTELTRAALRLLPG